MAKKRLHKFLCTKCQFVYDPSQGGGEAAPNTPFEKLPENWVCPKCGASQIDFRKKYEVVYVDM